MNKFLPLLFLSCAPCSYALDIDRYEVVGREVPLPRAWRRRSKQNMSENILCFHDSRIRVRLSGNALPIGVPRQTGFDRNSLKISWLDEGKLLWISWFTLPMGAGVYNYECDVILKMNEGSGTELYRECFLRAARQGCDDWESRRCGVSYDSEKRGIIVVLQETSFLWRARPSGAPPEEGPLFLKFGGDARWDTYARSVRIVERSRYKLTGSRMVFQSVEASLELREGTHDLEDVARFLLTSIYPNRARRAREKPVSAEELKASVAELREDNPRLRGRDRCSGVIAFPSQNLHYIKTTEYDGTFGYGE